MSRPLRTVAILFLLALPVPLGSVWPSLFPIDEDSVAVISEDGAVKSHPFRTEKAFAVQHRRLHLTFMAIAISCTMAAVVLGLLNVKHTFLYALALAAEMTYGWLLVDGTAAPLGLIMFALPFWLTINLCKMILGALRPRGASSVAPVRLPLEVAANPRLQGMANELLTKIETASSWSQCDPLAQEFAQALLDAGADEGDLARTLHDMHISERGSVQIITAARTRPSAGTPGRAPADPKPLGQ